LKVQEKGMTLIPTMVYFIKWLGYGGISAGFRQTPGRQATAIPGSEQKRETGTAHKKRWEVGGNEKMSLLHPNHLCSTQFNIFSVLSLSLNLACYFRVNLLYHPIPATILHHLDRIQPTAPV
jgi:hypothetical protein